jgi:hypothetical protein
MSAGTVDRSHFWVSPDSFKIDAPAGAQTCARCGVCTCHEPQLAVTACPLAPVSEEIRDDS